MSEPIHYQDPMEAFANFLLSEERYSHLWPDDFDTREKPDIFDAVREYAQACDGERQTLVLPGMEEKP